MKKLLALVLCVMLFVSVIPTSAFAYSSSGSGVSGSAIDLSPAYTARNNLFAALCILGEAHMYKNAITGIDFMKNDKNASALEGPIKELKDKLSELKMRVDFLAPKALSYYGIAAEVLPTVATAYYAAGNVVVADCTAKEADVVKDAQKAYNDTVNAIEIPAAPAVPSVPELK